MYDIPYNPPINQAAIVALGIATVSIFAWLPQREPVKTECEKPLYLPTASDAPPYSWEWPLQETDEPRRRRHRRG